LPIKYTFAALDYRGNTYRKQLFTRVWAVLLLVIFVNALLIEGIHHHQDTNDDCSKASIENVKSYQQFDVTKLKCKLCEVLKNQSHFYDVPAPVAILVYLDQPKENTFVYINKHPDAYILAAANKGPPSFMS